MRTSFISKILFRLGISFLLSLSLKSEATTISLGKFAFSNQWLKALHYDSSLSGLKFSTTSKGFYLSPKPDPLSELVINIRLANEVPDYSCRFPYRKKLLQRNGFLDSKNSEPDCQKLVNWKGIFAAEKLSIVFASQYLSNPASAFGHTFFIFSPDRKISQVHPPFLDIAVNYAADMPAKVSAFDYVWKGLTGGYKGHFHNGPMYEKIHEYADMELRDLWLYPLKLSKEQIDDLLDHIYELSSRDYFDYFFFTKNCSLMLLEIINTVNPELSLKAGHGIYVLPQETIQTLQKNDLTEEGVFIPGLRTKFLASYSSLPTSERKSLKEAIKNKNNELDHKESLDTLITYLDMVKFDLKRKISKEETDRYQNLLIRRSQKGPATQQFNYNEEFSDPVEGHLPMALSASYGMTSSSFQELEFRPGVHELLDLGQGQLRHSELKFLSPTLRRTETGSVVLQKFQFFNITNLIPYNRLDPIYSWKASFETNKLLDSYCPGCSVNRINAQIGANFRFKNVVDIFLLPGVQLESGRNIPHHYRGGLGGTFGSIYGPSEKIKALLEFSYFPADEFGQYEKAIYQSTFQLSYNFRNDLSLRLSFISNTAVNPRKTNDESKAGLVWFF